MSPMHPRFTYEATWLIPLLALLVTLLLLTSPAHGTPIAGHLLK